VVADRALADAASLAMVGFSGRVGGVFFGSVFGGVFPSFFGRVVGSF
jgi:hypothetical protein